MDCYRNAMSTGTEGVHTVTRASLLRGFAALALVGCSRRHQEQSNSTVTPLGLAPKVSGSSVPTEGDGTSPQFMDVARGAPQHVAFVASHFDGWEQSGDLPRVTRIDTSAVKASSFRELDANDRVGKLGYAEQALYAGGRNMDGLLRLDPNTLETVERLALPRIDALVGGAQWMFAASVPAMAADRRTRVAGGSTIHRIDAAKGKVTASLALPDFAVGSLGWTGSTLFALPAPDSQESDLLQIDPERMQLVRRISLRPHLHVAFSMACTRDHVLVGGPADPLPAAVLIVPADGTKPRLMPITEVEDGEHWLFEMAFAFGQLWATGEKHQRMITIDPKRWTARVVDGSHSGTERPQPIATNVDGIWVASSDAGKVSRVDPTTRSVTASFDVPAPVAIVAA